MRAQISLLLTSPAPSPSYIMLAVSFALFCGGKLRGSKKYGQELQQKTNKMQEKVHLCLGLNAGIV